MPACCLEAVHDRVPQAALVGEVAVDRALVHPGALGHGPDGQRPPVPDGRAVEELAARVDDPLARLGRPLAAQRAVVPATGAGGLGRSRAPVTG